MDGPLAGGNMNRVEREGGTVLRDAGPWTATVHRYLRHLALAGVVGIPEPLGVEDGRERLTFLEGDVPVYPLPAWVWTDDVLEQALEHLAPGGRLVYATCTFRSEENEAVAAAFERSHPGLERRTPERFQALMPDGYFRTFPHRHGTDGIAEQSQHVGQLASDEVADLAADQDECSGHQGLEGDRRLHAAHCRVQIPNDG